jgi:hypothetical protein
MFYDTNGKDADRLLAKLRQSQASRMPVWRKDCARAFRR